jgi:hypothetical protein
MSNMTRDPRRQKRNKGNVRVGRSQTGKGVFANRRFKDEDLVGEIVGELIDDTGYGSDYCFDLESGVRMEPSPPFRFINHSCDPNCEFDFCEITDAEGAVTLTRVLLFALRPIGADEQLTIDYNWQAEAAIPCRCGSAKCRGWIVDPHDLWKLTNENKQSQ